MPRSTTPRPEAPQLSTSFSILDNARFSSASAPNSTHSARLRSKLHAAGEDRTLRNLAPIRADPQRFGHPPHSLPGSGPVRADPPPGTGEHRTPRNLGECAPSHPRLCQASNHCENRYISRKTLTSAVVGHVCTFGSDDPRVFSDFNPLLRRPHLSTSMSASVSQLPNGKHSPLSHRNGTYYWQGE